MNRAPLGWLGIVRLGLVQAALGSIVVLTTSTLNRVMVVELALPALLPGALVALHYLVQVLRPRLGHGSDMGGRRTPWIIGGMGVLALGGALAAVATAWMGSSLAWGVALAIVAFMLIGIGVGAAGTSLLVLLAKRVAPARCGAAATIVWLMMIVGFVITATASGQLLDPYSPERLVTVTAGVSLLAFLVACLALRNVEGAAQAGPGSEAAPAKVPFRTALAEAWGDPQARRFTIFVFISMLAYSAQDLILEPFAGTVFGFTPGESTKLSGLQHGGVLAGMLLVGLVTTLAKAGSAASLRHWTLGGCVASAVALAALAAGGLAGPGWPLRPAVFLLGVANGAFSIAAIGSMMRLAGAGGKAREGVRMGLWGAAQAVAFGLGGLVGTGASDLARYLVGTPGTAYALVFAAEALFFLYAARLSWGVGMVEATIARPKPVASGAPRTAGMEGA
jgi:BCD family chlorophyll transporter-like MFS transporter